MQCCDVTADGQTATRLCGSGSVVPQGSATTAYDGGQVRCRGQPVATDGALTLGTSTVVAACTAVAYLMA